MTSLQPPSNVSKRTQAWPLEENHGSASETTGTKVTNAWRLHLRPDNDDDPPRVQSSNSSWWFASTAIPLLAATFGPLANVMSIAALITSWRNYFDVNSPGVDALSIGFLDPHWCISLNAVSLVCGFVGNFFLLLNFTKRVRYIVALPATIVLWFLATGIVSLAVEINGITLCMDIYVPPQRPEQTYSQGFWHAVIAAVLYLSLSMVLMFNMLGYFLGHYPQHFELSDEQRNLILQTMMFFIWLAGGAGVFARLEPTWQFVDALYFCDVTILTVGFGDFHPTNDISRGMVFPYSVGGIIILGLMVSSIRTFAQEISHDNIVRTHAEKRRVQTIDRSVTTPFELEQRQAQREAVGQRSARKNYRKHGLKMIQQIGSRKPKLLLLQEEKDRFDAMRSIQRSTSTFKKYSALSMSVIACAIGFWKAEAKSQGLTYFQALYFCYVSLLTIGYGDLSPTSNAGKPFFIVWSLVAVPTMTILISDMGDTVIGSFKRGTFTLADWTVLPKAGLWRSLLQRCPRLWGWLHEKVEEAEEEQRIARGFSTGPVEEIELSSPTLEQIAELDALDQHTLARKLSLALREVANDLRADPPIKYSYEQWATYTRLIRFSRLTRAELDEEEKEQGLIEWDWIGEDSPMLTEGSESEWLLDRLDGVTPALFLERGLLIKVGKLATLHYDYGLLLYEPRAFPPKVMECHFWNKYTTI
ncbi:MAG: hypothetical protein Q9168_002138 [Polycauliona sp. 1 TL-2023]